MIDRRARNAKAGDWVRTNYSGRLTEHRIMARMEGARSQSGIMFKLHPPVPKSSGGWIDADWFFSMEDGNEQQDVSPKG